MRFHLFVPELLALSCSVGASSYAFAQAACEPEVVARCTWVETHATVEIAFLIKADDHDLPSELWRALETHAQHHGWPPYRLSEPDRVPENRRASCPREVLDQIENLSTTPMPYAWPVLRRLAMALQRNGRAEAANTLLARPSMDLHTEMIGLSDLAEAEGDFGLAFAQLKLAGFRSIVCGPPGMNQAFDLYLARLAARARLWDAARELTATHLFQYGPVQDEFLALWLAVETNLGPTRDPREIYESAVASVGPGGQVRFAAVLRSFELARLDDAQLATQLVDFVRGDSGSIDRAFRILVEGGAPVIETTLQQLAATPPGSDNTNIVRALAMLGDQRVETALDDFERTHGRVRRYLTPEFPERWRALTSSASESKTPRR